MPEEKRSPDWTVDTLFVHFQALLEAAEKKTQQKFEDADKGVNAALAAAEKAVGKAEQNAEKWRDNANEWRGAMSDREKNFAPLSRLVLLEGRFEKAEGTGAGLKQGWGYLIGAVGLALAIYMAFRH